MKSKNINTLSVQFSLPLRPHQIPQWRGAVAESAGWEKDLFHNHGNSQQLTVGSHQLAESRENPVVVNPALVGTNGVELPSTIARPPSTVHRQFSPVLYRYPLIQYRVHQGHAAIIGINEGAKDLRRWLLQSDGEIEMGGRKHSLMIDGMKEASHQLRMFPQPRFYRLMDYIPFGQENYQRWKEADDLTSRIQLLESVLTRHIISLVNVTDWRMTERLEVRLMMIRDTRTLHLHKIPHLGFNLVFKANIDLPPNMALGRGVSHGFGVQRPTRA